MNEYTEKIYCRVVKLIAKRENITIDHATDIVNYNRPYLIDTIENSGEDTVPWLATKMLELFNKKERPLNLVILK